MAKRNLQAALRERGSLSYVDPGIHETFTDEQLKEEAFKSRRNQEGDVSEKMANDNRRNTLLRKAGFDWFDIEELHPHPENQYSIDEESIKNLAGLIYKSKEIQPLVVRETREGIQIIDGERRWRACRLLAEKYGDAWRMVPAHCHALDSLTEQEVEFILHSNNLGQRDLTPSEKAMGFKVVSEALVEWRKDDPSLKGVKTKTYLAEHFGVSERTAMANLTIAKNLTKRCLALLDEKILPMKQAEKVSRLTEDQQEAIAEILEENKLTTDQIDALIIKIQEEPEPEHAKEEALSLPKKEAKAKTTNSLLKNARNSLRKAVRQKETPDPELIAQIKKCIIDLDERLKTEIGF